MQKPYFILVVAHSLHGRLRRVHLPHSVMYGVLALAFIGLFTVLGVASSYVRMAWKVSNYNSLRTQLESLQGRYQQLQKESEERSQQMATLQLFASEVSTAYGIQRRQPAGPATAQEGRLVPSVTESLDQYNYLKTVTFAAFSRSRSRFVSRDAMPSIWPVNGRLVSSFGMRLDPFSGHGAFHAGVDIHCPMGTPIRTAADGRVTQAGWMPGYGILVVVNHDNGLETLYAHLSKLSYMVGQEVRRGDVIGYSGSTGHSTGPHLHYEVRVNGAPVNPYRYLQTTYVAKSATARRELPF